MSNEYDEGLSPLTKSGIFTIILVVILLICAIIFRVLWVTNIENYELGFTFDAKTGLIEVVEKKGWLVRTPIRYSVHTIDLRPYQISITANQRVLNAKLVQFNPEGLQTFVEWHGRDAGDESSRLLEILKSYAFDPDEGEDCPFLHVVGTSAYHQTMQEPLTSEGKK